MKAAAIEQARARLAKARGAATDLAKADSFAAFQVLWSDFLIAAAGIYSKLEQGAKGSGVSEAWFGRKKHDRKKDPLLSYLHHARNTDEHGIEPTAEHKPGSLTIHGDIHLNGMINGPAGTALRVAPIAGGRPPEIRYAPARIVLVPVTDPRYNDTFHPPASHLGEPLSDTSPIAVASLALTYFESLLAEATKLTQGK